MRLERALHRRAVKQWWKEGNRMPPDSPGESAPVIQDLAIGTGAQGSRMESDSMGEIAVPAEHYWGAQTQRSLHHFAIGDDRMPLEVCRAYGYIKKAAARVNGALGLLPEWKAGLIERVSDELIAGKLDSEFPLYVWQTGSGTQTNMNVNEVIANRATQLAGGTLGSKRPVHPNEHVNMSQSTNDTFAAAMHVATVLEFSGRLIPAVTALKDEIHKKACAWVDVIKLGRTHLQDATPLTVGQEWSGYEAQLDDAVVGVKHAMEGLYPLALGGTAVGTGLNAPAEFGGKAAAEIAALTGHPFMRARNLFAAQGSLDAMVAASAALRGLAVALMKIANDLRWLGSGPRAGLHELNLPENEPGSSIMPGKVNPTQQEAMVMVCIQVIGEDNAVAFAGSQGNFELNAMRPIIIRNVLHCSRILADACSRFRQFGVEGITLNRERIQKYLDDSLMTVTALSPAIGYDMAARIAHRAMRDDVTIREAAMEEAAISASEFDRLADPAKMVGDPRRDVKVS
jgi:fumarate hydratase, class II